MRNKQEDLELGISQLDNNFSDAWNVILELANGSYEPAMEFVADCYYRGKYVNMDEPLAFKWFSRIIETYPDNGDIFRKIGDCYCYGYGVSTNHDEALIFYQRAWDKGAYNAGSDIGWLYAFGELSNHDEREAGKWFQRAADKGVPQGHYFLGYFYDKGYGGLPISTKLAYKHLREAADYDNLSALRYLLREKHLCQSETEWEQVKCHMESIAQQGNTDMQVALGMSYLFGFGVEKNADTAKYWLEMAVKQHNKEAIFELGKAYLDSDSGFGFDAKRGYEYLLICAEAGNKDAMYELYRYYKWPYSYGRVPSAEDEKHALEWGIKAIEAGSRYICGDIAELLFNGVCGQNDYERAAYYYQMALKEDEKGTYYLPLAICYLKGNLSNANYRDVHTYLALANEYANDNAYYAGKKGEIEFWIGHMYEKGLGFDVNLEQAYVHFSKSNEYGFEEAKERICHYKKGLFGWKLI